MVCQGGFCIFGIFGVLGDHVVIMTENMSAVQSLASCFMQHSSNNCEGGTAAAASACCWLLVSSAAESMAFAGTAELQRLE